MSKLDGVGLASIDHVSYLVRTGELDNAVGFFVKQLGWVESDPPIKGDWGRARFVKPTFDSLIRVQLTEHLSYRGMDVFQATHLAIKVKSVGEAAKAIQSWASEVGWACSVTPANPTQTKVFVEMGTLFTFKLELID